MHRTALELAALCGAELVGDPELRLKGPASLEAAEPDEISYFGHVRYRKELAATRAGALIVPRSLPVEGARATLLRCDDPNAAFGRVFEVFGRLPSRPAPGVHSTAVLGRDVVLGAQVAIGPYCIVGDGAVLGDGVVLHSHVVVGPKVRLGAATELRSFVTLYDGVSLGARCVVHAGTVIGADGFGFDPVLGRAGLERWDKIPHGGTVEIADDVEIGANCTIDRGRFEATRIGRGAKLDNLVHVAHNVQVGAHVLLIAQVGIAGSSRIGEGAVFAGQAGLSTHLEVGAGARIGPASAVFENLGPNQDYMGYWAQPRRDWLRQLAQIKKLGELFERVRELEKRLENQGGRA
jgi:UDP-3-O-[3-hydroxymyristoyl] glucosamine N-acyltransferase